MGDGQSVQSESWRPQRHERSVDPQVKRMALIAGGVVAVLAVGYGGYALVGRAPRTIPVIEADSRPIRVRPDNPGGMQVAGAEEQIMGGPGTTGQADTMAPAPEIPQPQALRAQIQAARQPAPPPLQPVSLATPPAPPPPVISALPEQRPAAIPAKPPAATARTPAAAGTPASASTPAAAGTEVQLAALDTEAAAMAEWGRLAKRMPDLLATHHPAVQRTERDGKTYYRLRTGGFTDIAQATTFCTQVKAKGGGCSIASF